MRYLTILILIVYIIALIESRPSQIDSERESGEDETDYEDNKEIAEEAGDESDLQPSETQEAEPKRTFMDMNNNIYQQENIDKNQCSQTDSEVSDYKSNKNKNLHEENDAANIDEYTKLRQFSRYTQNNDAPDQQEAQRLNNVNVNNYRPPNQLHNNILSDDPMNKRVVDPKMKLNEEGDMLFQFNKDQTGKVDRSDYNNEPLDLNQHYSKQFYDKLQPDDKAITDNKNNEYESLYSNRDRRNTESNKQGSNSLPSAEDSKANLEKNNNEDEEMAIKNYVNKLSKDELQGLLNSLPNEKRSLLLKIIEGKDISDNEGINKREITKKAEAVADNSYLENSQPDSNKIIVSSATVTETPQTTETTEVNKQPESKSEPFDISSSKSTDTTNNANMQEDAQFQMNNNNFQQTSDITSVNIDKNDKSEIITNEQVTAKTENKREINNDNYISFEDPNQQQSNFDSKFKSLEESFPNSDAYDESGPLIRVKRTNSAMKKRAAAILPDAKVGFVPYRAENDDVDNDEGNEFDDDGFYDRTPNFCSSDTKNAEDSDHSKRDKSYGFESNMRDHSTSLVNELNKETVNLGTDTDSVISGVGAVDDNLMYSANSRIRRTIQEDSEKEDESNAIQSLNPKSLDNENKAISENNFAPNYQENDSFGPLPRNCVGDSGRYKRIRRVKQSHPRETSSNT